MNAESAQRIREKIEAGLASQNVNEPNQGCRKERNSSPSWWSAAVCLQDLEREIYCCTSYYQR